MTSRYLLLDYPKFLNTTFFRFSSTILPLFHLSQFSVFPFSTPPRAQFVLSPIPFSIFFPFDAICTVKSRPISSELIVIFESEYVFIHIIAMFTIYVY